MVTISKGIKVGEGTLLWDLPAKNTATAHHDMY